MLSLWKKRKSAKKQNTEDKNNELIIPSNFLCPISLDLMKDPVVLPSGITYDRDSIEAWLEAGNRTCPLTKQVLPAGSEPIPNHSIRKMIQAWCVENADSGVERIATPRTPVSLHEARETLARIEAARDDGKVEMCRELIGKLRNAMEDSRRNKRCFDANGAAKVLLATFDSFAKKLDQNALQVTKHFGLVLEETLTTLVTMLPLDAESRSSQHWTDSSLRCLVWFMSNGSLPRRSDAVLVLREVLCAADQLKCHNLVTQIGHILDALVNLVKDPICPSSTKAALLSMHYLITKSKDLHNSCPARLSELGMVTILTEKLVDCNRSECEKALAVLDGLCSSGKGKETAAVHALTVPIVVKKLHRVSDLSTEFSVSILWKLGKYDESVIIEALQVGAFQKLLLLLQIGCSEVTKEKAGELLKMMNVHKDKAECIEAGDFRNLKRTF